MAYVLGIAGSPRRGGNTEVLLDMALEGARSNGARVEKIVLNELHFRPCQECGGCNETGACILEDGLKSIYEKVRKADAIVVASPIFFGSVTGQLKSMIDRFQCFWVLKYVLKKIRHPKRKKGIFLCTGGFKKRKFFRNAKSVVKTFFATIDADYAGELFYGGADGKTTLKRSNRILNKAFRIGVGLVHS